MNILGGLRQAKAAGVIALLGVWLVVPHVNLSKNASIPAQTSLSVSDVAIEVPQHERKACHHHPAGCPKDCFCPKTSLEGKHAEEGFTAQGGSVSGEQGTLSEPALTQCTEDAVNQGFTFATLALPSPPHEFNLFEISSALMSATLRAPADRSPDLPQKIPIA